MWHLDDVGFFRHPLEHRGGISPLYLAVLYMRRLSPLAVLARGVRRVALGCMSMVLVMESWIVSIFGWVWLTVQDMWMPSLLSSFVFYGFLLLSTWHLFVCSMFPDVYPLRVAYFNAVFALCLFCGGCILDTFHTGTFGTPPAPPANVSWACCVNCDIPRYNRALFFADTPLYVVEAGVLLGYLVVHLIMAGAQMLELGGGSRGIWTGGAGSLAYAMMVTCRFIILFNGKTNNLVPHTVFYLLVYSQPLLSLSTVYWLFMCVFMILLICEGIPTMDLTGIRVTRAVSSGVVAFFVVLTVYELWAGGMLTSSLLVSLILLLLWSCFGIVEAFLGQPYSVIKAAEAREALNYYYPTSYPARRMMAGGGGQVVQTRARDSVVVPVQGVQPVQRLTKEIIPVPIQMQPGKKGV